MDRRSFLKSAAAAVPGVYSSISADECLAKTIDDHRNTITAFDYRGVTLLESRWRSQVVNGQKYLLSISNDDILKGFRSAAGISAAGRTLGGWCARDSSTVFGQWLSAMARLYQATGDSALRDKAINLTSEFAKTITPGGDTGMRHYSFDKLVCGLVDLGRYGDYPEALLLLDRISDFAIKNLDRSNHPAIAGQSYQGTPHEWYTLAENQYRAYQQTGDLKFKSFAEVWLYHSYWNKFEKDASPSDAHGVHAYSHLNSFSSCAMMHDVEGDAASLQILKNAYAYMNDHQCYATGGFGPTETFMALDGGLGRALDTRSDTFETGCGSWAIFKLSRYLTKFTGDAHYGDWMERAFYNGVGAALPVAGAGKNFYYSDYRVSGGMKVYNWEAFTCCSGTYFQDLADYHNLIYYKDQSSLYVNLYIPSVVAWKRPEGEVRVTQETTYPQTDTSTLTVGSGRPASFALKLRIPAWTSGATLELNGKKLDVPCRAGDWATVTRVWTSGDRLQVKIPLSLRMQPVDKFHPDRVAVVRGPVVLVLEGDYHDPNFRLPSQDADLERWLVADNRPTPHGSIRPGDIAFRVNLPNGHVAREKFVPYYVPGEAFPYKMYFDRNLLPVSLW